jgi:pimeloyl-ACP methyl ester carboxylesterase
MPTCSRSSKVEGVAVKRALGFLLLLLFVAAPTTASAAEADAIASRSAKVDGVELHYLTAGKGPASVVVLKNTGHWVMEENFKETTDALMKFL